MQTREEVIAYCLKYKDVYEDHPFKRSEMTVIRHRKGRKVFAWIFYREDHLWINVKCSPDARDFFRRAYSAVVPAYHLNKEHWNSIIFDGTIPAEEIKNMIEESYELTKG